MYADDTVMYFTGSDINIIRENLKEDLKRVEQWLMSSRLILNQSERPTFLNKATVANLIRLCTEDPRKGHGASDEVQLFYYAQ